MKFFATTSFVFLFFFLVFASFRLFIPINKKSSQSFLIDIPAGDSFYKTAEILEQKQAIRSALDLKLLVLITGRPYLKKGEYELSPSMSLWTLFQILKEGREREFQVSFPEGFNHYEMTRLLKSHDYKESTQFQALVWDKKFIQSLLGRGPDSFEGYLFPDSYLIKKHLPAHGLIKTMVQNFKQNYDLIPKKGLSFPLQKHEIVTLASLIEKETGLAKERPLIASVFFNRLKKNQKLQTDPTILYALYLTRGFDIEKNIRKKDILFDSPYNTYVVQGLPPGPIANPGKESLKAVFRPDSSDFFYFVSRNDGSHHFSKTYKEHKQAVYKYQIQKQPVP